MILNGVTRIGNMAFNGCSGLAGMEIPESVTSIGSYAVQWAMEHEMPYIVD